MEFKVKKFKTLPQGKINKIIAKSHNVQDHSLKENLNKILLNANSFIDAKVGRTETNCYN